MKSTFGAPSFARRGAGQAGSDSPTVRPMRPGKVVPGLYSFNAMSISPYTDQFRLSFCVWLLGRTPAVNRSLRSPREQPQRLCHAIAIFASAAELRTASRGVITTTRLILPVNGALHRAAAGVIEATVCGGELYCQVAVC